MCSSPQTQVMTDPSLLPAEAVKKAKTKTKLGVKESWKYLAQSKYIRNLATLVIAYGMSINLVEVTWKAKLKVAYPNPTDYSAFMGAFSSTTGVVAPTPPSIRRAAAHSTAARCTSAACASLTAAEGGLSRYSTASGGRAPSAT